MMKDNNYRLIIMKLHNERNYETKTIHTMLLRKKKQIVHTHRHTHAHDKKLNTYLHGMCNSTHFSTYIYTIRANYGHASYTAGTYYVYALLNTHKVAD